MTSTSQDPQPMMPGLTIYHHSSAGVSATPSSQQSQNSRYQSEMKDLIEHEVKNATYYVNLTTGDCILPVEDKIVQAVINSLESTFQALTSEGDSSPTEPRFPVDDFPSEPPSYKPMAHLLNKIIDTTKPHLVSSSPLSELRFHPFGGEVKEKYGSHKGLKPDGVGIIGELSTEKAGPAKKCAKKPELSWEQIQVTFESKASVRDMVRQSGTYARCCILGNRRRFFSLGIGLHYKKLEAYVFVFHHSGVSSSHPLKLTTRDGFDGLVRHIVGMLSFKDEAAYGLDPTRFQDIFCINNRHYELVRTIYVRGSLRGRSTVVYSLQGMYTCGF
jgi:hypothetical protein